jgi:hypothetical protein
MASAIVDFGEPASQLKMFKQRLLSELIVGYFSSPSDLALRVVQALHEFSSERGIHLGKTADLRTTDRARDQFLINIEKHLNFLRSEVAEIRGQIETAQSSSKHTLDPSTHAAAFLGTPSETAEEDLCFVAMPYSQEWSKALEDTLLDICKDSGMRLLVAKNMDGRFIPSDIWQGITSAAVVIADITDANPNVAYEIGLADVLGKEVVLLCQGNTVPFDFLGQR